MADSEEKKDDETKAPPAAPTKAEEEKKTPEAADAKPSADAAAPADAKTTPEAEPDADDEDEDDEKTTIVGNKNDKLVFNFFRSPINNDIVLSSVHRNKSIKSIIDEIEAGLYLAGDFYGNATETDEYGNINKEIEADNNFVKTESLSKIQNK